MKVLAIDPGPEQSAFVCWDTDAHDFVRLTLVEGYSFMGIKGNWDLLDSLPDLVGPADLTAIEMVQSYGLGVGKEVFETCLWAGRFSQRISDHKIPVKFYGRPTIKGAIGGRSDAEIRASLRMRYGEAKKGCLLDGVKKDIWSALALAVALEENRNLKEW